MYCSRTFPRTGAQRWRRAPWPVGKVRADGYEPRKMERQRKSNDKYRVGCFVCSLSASSINRLLVKALVRLTPAELNMTEIPLGDFRSITATTTMTTRPVARTFKDAIASVEAKALCWSQPASVGRSPSR